MDAFRVHPFNDRRAVFLELYLERGELLFKLPWEFNGNESTDKRHLSSLNLIHRRGKSKCGYQGFLLSRTWRYSWITCPVTPAIFWRCQREFSFWFFRVNQAPQFLSGNGAAESVDNRCQIGFYRRPPAAPPGRRPAGCKGKARRRYRNKHSSERFLLPASGHKKAGRRPSARRPVLNTGRR